MEGSNASLSLDPPETSQRKATPWAAPTEDGENDAFICSGVGASGLAEAFRHSGWANHRRRIDRALRRTMQSVSRIASFHSCGARAFVYVSDDNPPRYRLGGSTCRDRFCSPCTRERGQVIAANITQHLAGRTAIFLTLTLKTQGLSLSESLTKLDLAFVRLLQSKLWLQKVSGGVGFTEIKYNFQAARWHPHLHLILEGDYLPQTLLSKLWLDITGDSRVVHLRLVKNVGQVIHYVTNYCSKSVRSADFPTDASLDEAITTLRGRRLCRTFGSWRYVRLTEVKSSGEWSLYSSFDDLLHRVRQREPDACAILEALQPDKTPKFLLAHPPRPPPPLLTAEQRPNDLHPTLEFTGHVFIRT